MVTSNENETPQDTSGIPQSTPAQVPTSTPEAAPTPAAPEAPANPETTPQGHRGNSGGGQGGGQGQGGNRFGGGQGGGQGGQGGGGNRGGFGGREERSDGLTEKVVFINRCAKVVKGGRRFSFSALVVAGDHNGKVGYGFGKAKEVAECIRKASEAASNNLQTMQLNGDSIPHETYAEYGGGKVLLKPASPGTGIIAGGGVRAVCESVGIKDVLGKSLGSNNHANVVKATLKALSELRNRDEILKLRGKKKGESI